MLKRQHIGDLFTPFWNMAAVSGIPKAWFFNKKSKKFRIGLLGLLLAINGDGMSNETIKIFKDSVIAYNPLATISRYPIRHTTLKKG